MQNFKKFFTAVQRKFLEHDLNYTFSMDCENIIFSRFGFVLLQIVLQEAEIINQGKTVFAQIMSLIPRYEFDKCVKRYNGNRHAIGFKCRDQFLVMSFALFTDQVSLRSIDATLVALSSKLYSGGIKYIQRSTLAHINETKDWRIYHDFGQILIAWARKLCQNELSRLDVDGIVNVFDGSTIKLCLQLCPWARLNHDTMWYGVDGIIISLIYSLIIIQVVRVMKRAGIVVKL